MKSRDFCYWLQGFFELTECPHGLSTDRTETIKRHLALVFEHEIDPSIDGHDRIAVRWEEPICGMCGAPRTHAEPGCPVRNAVSNAIDEMVGQGKFAESVADGTARERRVHDGGPRIVHRDSDTGEILEHDPDTGETKAVR